MHTAEVVLPARGSSRLSYSFLIGDRARSGRRHCLEETGGLEAAVARKEDGTTHSPLLGGERGHQAMRGHQWRRIAPGAM